MNEVMKVGAIIQYNWYPSKIKTQLLTDELREKAAFTRQG
jgi:hypothetical protein